MTINITYAQILTALGVAIPLMAATLRWAIRTAIRAEVTSLELRVARDFMSVSACRQIREECERYRCREASLHMRDALHAGGE